MWPFKSEVRNIDVTEQYIGHLENLAGGTHVDASALAIFEACVGLWERSLSSGAVGSDVPALAGIDAPLLALVGRSLATTGNFVGVIRVTGGAVNITPASSYDVSGGADQSSWVYRVRPHRAELDNFRETANRRDLARPSRRGSLCTMAWYCAARAGQGNGETGRFDRKFVI